MIQTEGQDDTKPRVTTDHKSDESSISSTVCNNLVGSPQMTNIHSYVETQTNSSTNSATCIASKMILCQYPDYDYTEYATILGAPKNIDVLREFIRLLRPLPDSLLATLEKLSSRLYFITEAQNIDRILEELSKQWIDEHPNTEWGLNYHICHIVLFSLLILNSDLHDKSKHEKKKNRFSSKNFVQNTLNAIREETENIGYDIDNEEQFYQKQLQSYYNKLKYKPLPLLTRAFHTKVRYNRKPSLSSVSSRSASDTSTLISTYSHGSTLSNATNKNDALPPTSSDWKFRHNIPLPPLYKRESLDNIYSHKQNSIWYMNDSVQVADRLLFREDDIDNNKRKTRASSSSSSASKSALRWLKKSSQSAFLENSKSPVAFMNSNSKWNKARLIISEGRIFIFRLKKTETCQGSESMDIYKKKSSHYYVYNLFEAIAKCTQDNIVFSKREDSLKERNQKGSFTVSIPVGLHGYEIVLEFLTNSLKEAHMFVMCINFWAARLTPVPSTQFEIVSNEEYGWSEQALKASTHPKRQLGSWVPLPSIDLLSDGYDDLSDGVSVSQRLDELTSFTEQLDRMKERHNSVKQRMVDYWTGTDSFEKAMDNWNKKYLYLNHLFDKSNIYLQALQSAQQ